MTLVAVGMGIFEHRFERPRRAIAAIERAGGFVRYADRRDKRLGLVEAWLRNRLPRGYFDNVVAVEVPFPLDRWEHEIGTCLPHLPALHALKRVDFGFNNRAAFELSDDELAPIARVGSLRELHLGEAARIGDEGLAHIGRCTALEKLDLAGTKITDAGLKHLASLTSLRQLYLGETAIGDEGLSHLKNLTSLEVLELSQTHVTDAGMPIVASFSSLRELDLGRTSVGDQGVRALSRLKALEKLRLSETRVGDAGLGYLFSVTSLRDLELDEMQFSGRIDALRESLPKCRVDHGVYFSPIHFVTRCWGGRFAPAVPQRRAY